MKKKILFTSLILGITFLINYDCSSSVFAEENIDGIRYWDISEMVEFREEVNSEIEERCSGRTRCEESLYYEHLELGGKYLALDLFENISFMVTSINPSTNSVKLFFNDKDKMLSRMFGYDVYHYITDLYVLWIEEWVGDPLENAGWLSYGYRYPYYLMDKGDVISASHIIMDENESRNGINWFEPNTELEYFAEDGNIVDDSVHRLYYSLRDNEGGRTNGSYDYNSCIDSPYYNYGIECRVMFSEYGDMVYLPFSNGEEGEFETEDIAVEENSNNLEPELLTEEDASDNDGFGEINADVTEETNEEILIITNTENIIESPIVSPVKTPETGLPTKESSSVEFPWWLGAIFLLNGATFVWLFWPKKSKKAKKSLDKFKEVR